MTEGTLEQEIDTSLRSSQWYKRQPLGVFVSTLGRSTPLPNVLLQNYLRCQSLRGCERCRPILKALLIGALFPVARDSVRLHDRRQKCRPPKISFPRGAFTNSVLQTPGRCALEQGCALLHGIASSCVGSILSMSFPRRRELPEGGFSPP